MANIITDIEKGIEIGAEDALKAVAWITKGAAKVESAEPAVVAAFGTLCGAVSTALTAVESAGSGGLSISLDAAAATALKSAWPAVESFLASLGIKL